MCLYQSAFVVHYARNVPQYTTNVLHEGTFVVHYAPNVPQYTTNMLHESAFVVQYTPNVPLGLRYFLQLTECDPDILLFWSALLVH